MRIENTEVENVKLYGPVHALHKVTQDTGLGFIIGEYAPEVLSLVYSHILRPESLNNIGRALKWISTDEIGLELPVSRKRLESAMDDLAKRTHYIERELYPKISDVCDLGSLFYDISGIYFYGKNVKVAKRGHGSNRPQIGIGLAVEAQYGIPLFHHVFDGNVFDAKTFPVILGRFTECAREKCILVFDRGVATKKNVRGALSSGFSVIACIPLKGKGLKEIASKEMRAVTPKDACKLSSVFIHAREITGQWADIPVRMIICLNRPLREQIQQNRYYELEEALEKLGRNARIKDGLKKYIKKVDGISEVDYDAVEESEKFDGVYIIITNTDVPKETVVKKYFDKDIIEKSFQSLKSTLSIQPVRHWLWRRVRAHIFICYLAYLHLSWMKMLFEKSNISLSPVKALEQLETIYNVKLTDTKTGMSTTKTVPLTEEQERIYRALNLLS
jgi:transposase